MTVKKTIYLNALVNKNELRITHDSGRFEFVLDEKTDTLEFRIEDQVLEEITWTFTAMTILQSGKAEHWRRDLPNVCRSPDFTRAQLNVPSPSTSDRPTAVINQQPRKQHHLHFVVTAIGTLKSPDGPPIVQVAKPPATVLVDPRLGDE